MVNFTIVPHYDEKAFSADVIKRWGDVQPGLKDMANLLHVQMGELAALCNESPVHAEDVFSFLEEVVDRDDVIAEIENAVMISFVVWPDAEKLAKDRRLSQRILNIIREGWEWDSAASKARHPQ
jgi:hypothetical protein